MIMKASGLAVLCYAVACAQSSSEPSVCSGQMPPERCSAVHSQRLAGLTLTGVHDTAPEWRNQDAFLVHSDCGTHARGIVLIGVFDGHGRRGEHISTQLASAVRTASDGLCDELDQIMQRQECSDLQQCQALISGVLYTLSNLLETSLDRHDASSGGSTAVICIVAPGSYSITANVGDSRAMAVRVSNADILKLSQDHDVCASHQELGRILDLSGNSSSQLWHAAVQGHQSAPQHTWKLTDNLGRPSVVEQRRIVDEEGWAVLTLQRSSARQPSTALREDRCASLEFAPQGVPQPATACVGRVGGKCAGGLRMTRCACIGSWSLLVACAV